ncbi:MAG: ABC transporter permease [Chloroflexia bacterium]|nr:ABC transporter permease [Chloroflexia bacterium]
MSTPPLPAKRPGVALPGVAVWRGWLGTLLPSVGAILVALLLGAVLILISGDNVITAYSALFRGAFGGSRPLAETLVASTPLILGGLAFAIAARAGLFNIGIEGQMILGGIAAGLVGSLALGVPAVVHLPLALVAAALAGGLWGALPGALKAWSGAHEVITTIMLNYLAYRLSSWVIRSDHLFNVNAGFQATDPVAPAARLPRLLDGTRLHSGIIVAIVAAAVLWYLLFRTTLGYKVRTVGASRGAAAYGGISWGRTIVIAMLASGLLAGLAGAGEALGLQGRYYNQPSGYGFTAIAVGLVGRNHPWGVVLAGLLFGALSSGATEMQNSAGTSREIVEVLQGLVILSVAALAAIGYLRSGRWAWLRARGGRPGRGAGEGSASAIGMEPEVESRPGPPRL